MAETIFILIVLLFSVIIHEIAHGSMANFLGDSTAKDQGRLTLNPLKHIDLFGSIIVPLVMAASYLLAGISGPIVGWAKPVPINPYNLRDKRWGILKVSLAGPAANFFIGLIFALLARFSFNFFSPIVIGLFSQVAVYNFLWCLFNLIPIPPFDGFNILFSFFPSPDNIKLFLQRYGLFILIIFIFILPGLYWLSLGAEWIFFLVSGKMF